MARTQRNLSHFSRGVDQDVRHMGLRVIETPVRIPNWNDAVRVFGFRDFPERTASLGRLKRVGDALQRESATHSGCAGL
jgi:hypothetical protein